MIPAVLPVNQSATQKAPQQSAKMGIAVYTRSREAVIDRQQENKTQPTESQIANAAPLPQKNQD